VIRIDPYDAEEYVNLSEFADSIQCIRLQTDSSDILGRVREIIVKKRYIYAVDISQQMIFIFDKSGKFISKLSKHGQGPDEYNTMGPVFIDENEKFIEIINLSGSKTARMKYSNISFELIEAVPFPDLTYNSCKRNNGFYYFAGQQLDNFIDGRQTNADLLILDANNNLTTLFDKHIETNHRYFSPNTESFTVNDKNELFASFMYNHTFYRLEAEEAYPIVSVDFGKQGVDNSIGSRSTEKQLDYIAEMDGVASFPVLNVNNSDIFSFSYYFKKGSKEKMFREDDFRQYLKFKNKNKPYHVKRIKNDLTSFPDRIYLSTYFWGCVHEAYFEDYLVDIVLPNYYFLNRTEKKIFVDGMGEITEDDNPLVIMMKLKKE
jgi:hypothetical protein